MGAGPTRARAAIASSGLATSWVEHHDDPPRWELVRQQGVRPITSVNDMITDDPFTPDDEHSDFLADLHASRRSSIP